MANKKLDKTSALIEYLLAEKEKQNKNNFILTTNEIKTAMDSKGVSNFDPQEIVTKIRSDLRIKGITVIPVPNGYRFITTQVKKKTEPKKVEVVKEEKQKVKEQVDTMTDYDNRFIAPAIFHDIKTLIDNNLQVLIVGPPGCGKSRVLEEIAKNKGVHCIRRQMSQVYDPEVLLGQIQVVKDAESMTSVTKFVPGSLTQAAQDGMFFIGDEYDNATAACNEALKMISEQGGRLVIETEHGVEVVSKHDNFRMSFTANTWGQGDASGNFPNAQRQNAAALDRIDAFIAMDYDIEIEKAVMADLGIPNHVIEYFYFKDNKDPAKNGIIIQLRTALQDNEVPGYLGLRKIIAFSKIYHLLGWHRAFLYGIMSKFEPEDHSIFEDTIKSRFGEWAIPTNDITKIKKHSKELDQYKLKGV